MSTNNNILVEELRILGEKFRNKFSIHHLQELTYQTGMIQRKRKFQAQDLVSQPKRSISVGTREL
ncbi:MULTISPECIES: hypothetical protein [Bacillus cereus group]|uniref:hypothetical protein n=1 Tax=Bacillus cereus group TaxID=86661 RepID=UPI001CD9F6C9|nr:MULTISPECIES: hypothetical protein [Bacillus cereus group]MEA1011491.1 hypothetical protein [Bacillus cereus]